MWPVAAQLSPAQTASSYRQGPINGCNLNPLPELLVTVKLTNTGSNRAHYKNAAAQRASHHLQWHRWAWHLAVCPAGPCPLH